MAHNKKLPLLADSPSAEKPPSPESISFLIKRLEKFIYQAYKITVSPGGAVETVPVFKPDLLEIVQHKVSAELKALANSNYELTKKQKA